MKPFHRTLIHMAAFIGMLTTSLTAEAQAYSFLQVPVSAHSAALGGENISICDNDPALMFSNPALLSRTQPGCIGLNYMNYMAGANMLSASYSMHILEHGMLGFGAEMLDYGKMDRTNVDGIITGNFGAKDIALSGTFSYLLSEFWTAGITAKIITSYIADYSSLALGVDLGLSYYNEENGWGAAAVARNLGGQLDAYEEDYESLPLDLQLGISKRLIGSPLRLSGTLVDMNHLDDKLIYHLAFGADLILPNNLWVGMGYNFRRAHYMTIGTDDEESSHGAGLSLGAGLNLNRFKINLAWGKYHVSSSSVIINLTYAL